MNEDSNETVNFNHIPQKLSSKSKSYEQRHIYKLTNKIQKKFDYEDVDLIL